MHDVLTLAAMGGGAIAAGRVLRQLVRPQPEKVSSDRLYVSFGVVIFVVGAAGLLLSGSW